MFYQTAWPIIKHDVMHALPTLWLRDFRSFYLLNQVYMILLCKRKDGDVVQDFIPISLIHSFGKLVTKVLALWLAPYMDSLVKLSQSGFIQCRALHDNFRVVQLTTKLLHAHQLPSALLKVDIAMTFDTVR
jgi:hypothetical protein